MDSDDNFKFQIAGTNREYETKKQRGMRSPDRPNIGQKGAEVHASLSTSEDSEI